MSGNSKNKQFTNKKIALGVCGGIAAYKAVEVLRGLQKIGCSVKVGMTRRACEFIRPLTFRALSGEHVIVDDYDPDNPDPIAHITFSQSVDLLIIAPATANIIAKLANGIADDFLSSTYLASTVPVLIAPAMNSTMWQHPTTRRNIEQLKSDGVRIVEPDAGEMACKTIGPGRLSDPERIISVAMEMLQLSNSPKANSDLSGENILITAGATREEIDPVRFISNRSSGRMGFALAQAAAERGASVTVVAGVTSATEPTGNIKIVRVSSAEEMNQAVMKEIKKASVFIAAAAVADYRPISRVDNKIKKSESELIIKLEPTPDILKNVASTRHNGLLVIGFAAETDNVISNAQEKLKRKNLNAIVVNDITRDGAGFDAETNIVTIISKDRESPLSLPIMPKQKIAHHILDEVIRLRKQTIT
jgi:phosphopantothenoylcysteine decarboxylase / phosphopantothenate---cysteine ligase